MEFPGHGGKRIGAGRKPASKRPPVHHVKRPRVPCCERGDFRVCHYSIQRDHVHLVVEAAGKEALGRGMKSVGIRLARTVNRVFGRTGAVLFGRYHLRVLRTPREVRHALAYVLLNARKHWRKRTGPHDPLHFRAPGS